MHGKRLANGLREDRTSPTEKTARQGASMVPIDYGSSIDNHHFDTFGVLVRIVKRGTVGNCIGIEEHKIGGVTLDDCAAVREAECRGRAASHLVDRLRQADKVEIPGVMPKNPRKRSVKSGVWLSLPCYAVRCDARTIRADCHKGVSQNRPHVVLRHRTHKYPGGAAIRNDQVARDVEGILAPLAREIVACLACFRGR